MFLRFSSYIFSLKQNLVQAKNWTRALPYAVLLILAEITFIIISLPLYLAVSPKKLQERGFIFPTKEKEPVNFHVYIVRRRISLTTLFGAGGIFLLKFIFVSAVSTYLLGAQALLAASQDWNFNTAGDYTYDSAKIEVTGGVARLKDQGTGGSCSGAPTTCNAFISSPTCLAQAGCAWSGGASGSSPTWSTTWGTYADWENGGNVSGTSPTTGGNPTNYKDIIITRNSSAQTASGYWQQGFTTTAVNPETATINFDWSIKSYNGTYLTSYIIYVFVDNFSGAPTLGSEVWSQTVTGATGWATVSNLNVASKLTAAGTYYIKLVARRIKTVGNPPNVNNTVGWDNVSLNWTKNNFCSGAPTACNTYMTSGACATQGGCSWTIVPVYSADKPAIQPVASLSPIGVTAWNSFTETATKNGGEIYYQLSNDDGATWQYWNGSGWATAVLATDYNTATEVNTGIGSFDVSNGKIIWKAFLSSNGSQQVILDNIAIGYTQNATPVIQNLSAAQNTSSGYVKIDYTLRDDNSDPNSLVDYEYSLTGAFSGEQAAMTPAPTDPAHSGITGLSSSPSGVAHSFIWNARADLGNVYSGTVYVRLRASDGIANSDFAVSSVFSADFASPIISNVSAVFIPASSNVEISYDLSDDTTDNILVELQISSDGGSTWTVPVTTVSGDIGSAVFSGSPKAIIWQAGVDFSNQEQNNIMARVRAKDKYQNQGDYVNSAGFILDNRAPVVAVPADLLAQPLAGAATVLVGGSFSENNPNINNFYAAFNGGNYGSAEAGDANTATPSDKNVSVGTTLKGSDYISAVKIEHTDDFGHTTASANSSPNAAYKYVKPYTPPPLSVGGPGESSLELTINKNSAEIDGLEYAIWESAQNLYVQENGSLGGSPYWQAVGSITVIGLSQPISQYSFQVKSRNISDTSHSASSESDFSSAVSSDYRSPQLTINSVAQVTNGGKYVNINYTGNDYRNQPNSLTKYEYSLNGVDWQTMTEKIGAGSDGVIDLPFFITGVDFKFVWDVNADLPGVEDSTVYVRLESTDGVTNSNLVVSPAFTIDTAGPVVSNIQAIQASGTDNIAITYDLADNAGSNNIVALSISSDSGASYGVSVSSVTGDIGSSVTAGLARSIVWNAGVDFANQENSAMRVKIIGTDSYGNQGDPIESADFSVDTKAPVVSAVTAAQGSGSALVTVNYNLADLNSADAIFEVSADSGASWNVATTTVSGNIGSGQTAGDKTFDWNAVADFPDQELDTMRIRVRALDTFGHQSDYQESADFSLNTKMLSIFNITAEQTIGANTVIIHYDLNKTATISLEISADGGASWNVATSTLTGNVNTVVAKGNNKTINWNPGVDFNDQETSAMRIRLQGLDAFGTLSAYYESADFSVDTAAPLGLLSLTKFAGTESSVTLNWSPDITDANFNHYELWHGVSQSDVINRGGAAQKWSVANDPNLSLLTTIATVISGINLTSDYFVKIWAVDNYGNEATVGDLNVYSAPIITNYILTIQAPDGFGSTDLSIGDHSYLQDTNAQITAMASAGWAFDHWILDSLPAGSVNPLILLMDAAHTLQAVFTELTATSTPPVAEGSGGGGGGSSSSDRVAPGKPILFPLETPTNIDLATISGLAEAGSMIDLYDNGSLVERLSGSANSNGQFKQLINFSEGEHILTVKATDQSFNVSAPSDPINLRIKTVPPAAPTVLSPKDGDKITEELPVLTGVTEPLAQVEITLDGVNKFIETANIDGAWQFKVASDFALTDGEHSFVLIATDEAGNKSAETVLKLNKVTPPVEIKTKEIVKAPESQPETIPAAGQTTPSAPELIPTPLPTVEIIRENEEAVELPGMPVPIITSINTEATNNAFTFSGTALPNQEVLVYIHSDQALVYRARADKNGVWQINHSQDSLELAPGKHTIFAVAIDPEAKIKSKPSPVGVFTVSKSFWVSLFDLLNLQTTIITLIIILLAMFWLYQVKRKEAARV